MIKSFLFLILSFSTYTYAFAQKQINYPISKSECTVTTLFNTDVEDCYAWLELVQSEEVKTWIKEQNQLTNRIVNKKNDKYDLAHSIENIRSFEGDYKRQLDGLFFDFKYLNRASSASLFYSETYNGSEKLLIDPMDVSTKDNIRITNYRASENKDFLAYSFNRNGSDWHEIMVKKIKGKDPKDHLTHVFSSNVAFKDNGFFYIKAKQDSFLSNYTMEGVFYHVLESDQSQDKRIFFNGEDQETLLSFQLTNDKRFLLIFEEDRKTNLTNIYYIDYDEPYPLLKLLLKDLKHSLNIIGNVGDKMLAQTFHQGNFGYLVLFDINKPMAWERLTPEIEGALLLNAYQLKDKVLCIYQQNATETFIFYSFDGEPLSMQEIPNGIHSKGFNVNFNDSILLFYLYNEVLPPLPHTINTNTFEVKVENTTYVKYDFENITWRNITFTTQDSTEILLDIYYHKKSELENRPTILKTYGGFGVNPRNSFYPSMIDFILNDGIYVFAHIRGGGEKGLEWAQAGKRLNKQNSINDFIEAAEYLIKEGYTSPSKLATTGNSHGGLIVAAAAIQRPELYKVVVPVVGVYDMINFEKYTVGNLHLSEFGSIANPFDFKNLYQYSPYHNVEVGVNYPNMLVVTSDNDERVPPLHSFKFVAALQNNPSQENIVLLRTVKNYGHQGGTSYFNTIMESAETISFISSMLNEKE